MKQLVNRLTVLALLTSALAFSTIAQSMRNENLNGSFSIDTSKSENVGYLVESLARSNRISDVEKEELEEQLTAPPVITIRTSSSDPYDVTMSTSSSAETTFRADGRTQRVQGNDGTDARVTATLRDGVLRLSRVGNGSSFSITFAAENGGNALRVTRMVTTNYLDRTVYADSYYNKSSYSSVDPAIDSDDDTVPYTDDDSNGGYSSSDSDDVYSDSNSGSGNYPTTRTVANGRFAVPQGTVLTGTLRNKVTTKSSQDNDRFSLTVEEPSEFRGAVLEGYLSGIQRTGRATGTSRLTFNFETIRLRNGQVYDFAGVLQSVTDSTGKIVEIGKEGDAKGDSKTKESIKRGGIGAGVGAILGAIIGGGKGAIIGATIGGGAGAGSVIAQGRDDIELLEGSTLEVESTSPNR